MKLRENSTWLILVAILTLIAGGASLARVTRSVPVRQRHLEQKVAAIRELRHINDGFADDEAALATYESLVSRKPVELAVLLSRVLPEVKPAIRQRETKELGDGWATRRVEVTLDDMALRDVGPFLEEAEAQRPPWLLRECGILASDDTPGLGRITFVMETIEKTP